MPKINDEALRQVRTAFIRYEEEVKTAGLKESTEKTYITHSRNFVRWLDDDFVPGGRL